MALLLAHQILITLLKNEKLSSVRRPRSILNAILWPSQLSGQRIRGSRARCRLGVRLCGREKDLYEPFLRRVRGLEFAREARGSSQSEGSFEEGEGLVSEADAQ